VRLATPKETDALRRLTDTTDIRALGALFYGQDTKDAKMTFILAFFAS